MSNDNTYREGVPCWVDVLSPDPEAAVAFYGPLLGWTFDPPTAMPDGLAGTYRTARIAGRLVAGIGQAPAGLPSAIWTTYVAVDAIDAAVTPAVEGTEAADASLVDGLDAAVARAVAAGGHVVVGPTGHGDAGRVAVLTDPAGVGFGLWQAGSRRGAERVNEPGTWTMSSLHAPDGARASAFYGAVLGWSADPVPGAPIAFWRLDGYVGGVDGQPMPRDVVAVLAPIGPGDPTPPHWSIAIRVADVDATAQRAAGLGGTVLMPPTDAPGFRSAAIADPQGGVVALTEWRTMAG